MKLETAMQIAALMRERTLHAETIETLRGEVLDTKIRHDEAMSLLGRFLDGHADAVHEDRARILVADFQRAIGESDEMV